MCRKIHSSNDFLSAAKAFFWIRFGAAAVVQNLRTEMSIIVKHSYVSIVLQFKLRKIISNLPSFQLQYQNGDNTSEKDSTRIGYLNRVSLEEKGTVRQKEVLSQNWAINCASINKLVTMYLLSNRNVDHQCYLPPIRF